jgi:hypothetical protein
MAFYKVPYVRHRKVGVVCKCKLEWLAIWADIFYSRCKNEISPWTKSNSQTKFITARHGQWTWLDQGRGLMNIVTIFIRYRWFIDWLDGDLCGQIFKSSWDDLSIKSTWQLEVATGKGGGLSSTLQNWFLANPCCSRTPWLPSCKMALLIWVLQDKLLPWETELGYNSLMTILEGSKFGCHHELLLAV